MIMEQESSKLKIESLEQVIKVKNDKVQKMDFDLTVIFTEKQTFKKELDKQDQMIRQLEKDLAELKLRHDLLQDQNAKNLKQNSEYRDLILGNEHQMKLYREDMKELQLKIDNREDLIVKLKDEVAMCKDQVWGLEQQLREARQEKNDLVEENRKMMLGNGLVISDEQLKIKFQTLSNDFEFKRKEWESNEAKLHAQLNFSKESNESLKKDYDLLQEKFENYMRTNNTINESLKDEITQLQQKSQRLTFQLDDLKATMQQQIKEQVSMAQERELQSKMDLERKDQELQKALNELNQMKGEFNLKLTRLKLMEMELYNQKQRNEDSPSKLTESRLSDYPQLMQITSSRAIIHTQSKSTTPHTPQQQHQSQLPDKIDTQTVVEMIKNADLFDLINISLNSRELRTDQVEQFIQKALEKGHDNTRQRGSLIDPKQLELIFTPPSKIAQRQTETSPSNKVSMMSNDENFNILISGKDFNQRGSISSQQTLQPSILENSQAPLQLNAALRSIQYTLQNQITNSKQQMFEELQSQLQKRIQLDDSQDYGVQQPREVVPRPYSELPKSPSNDQARSSGRVIRHYQNQSFSDHDFVQESCQQTYNNQKMSQEIPFKGDQFSFHITQMQDSMIKKSQLSSQYSSLQEGTQASSQKVKNSPSSVASSKQYEQHFKFQHISRNQEDKQKVGQAKTQTNVKVYQQQPSQSALNRSTSSNFLQKSAERRSRNLNLNSTLSTKTFQRSFLNSTRNLEDQNKTPKSALKQKEFGNLTSRNQDTESKKDRSSSALRNLTDLKRNTDFRKQQFMNSFQHMNVKCLIELERIKKPSQLAYITARLVCQFFDIFKESNLSSGKHLHMEDLLEWSDIQKHICNHIMKQTNELLNSIKMKVLFPETISDSQKSNITLKLIQIRQEYFSGDNLKLFKHLSTNKTLQTIITFVYNVISCYLEMQLQDHQQTQSDVTASQSYSLKTYIAERIAIETQSHDTNKRSQLEFSAARRSTKNHNFLSKNDSTPQQENVQSVNPTLQKSQSRCLLQKRDHSQLLTTQRITNNNDTSYVSNKAKEAITTTPLAEPNSVKRAPLISRHKSKSPIVRNFKHGNPELSESMTKQRFAQRMNKPKRTGFLAIDNNQDLSCGTPLNLDYKLMIESSGFAELIKKTAADIEQNMKTSPQRKHIDMSIIESLKQRRKEQRFREASEDRVIEAQQLQ